MLEIVLSAKLEEIWYIPVVLHNKLRSFREIRISPSGLGEASKSSLSAVRQFKLLPTLAQSFCGMEPVRV